MNITLVQYDCFSVICCIYHCNNLFLCFTSSLKKIHLLSYYLKMILPIAIIFLNRDIQGSLLNIFFIGIQISSIFTDSLNLTFIFDLLPRALLILLRNFILGYIAIQDLNETSFKIVFFNRQYRLP